MCILRKVRTATAAYRIISQLAKAGSNSGLLKGLGSIDTISDQSPRSLNGCDRLLLPKILKDFPDFDVNMAKIYAKNALKEKLGDRQGFTVHNVVISQYLPSGAQKTVVFQAAIAYRSGATRIQKRYDLYYTYLLTGSSETIAANCPNCGGALGYGVTVCPFCASRVTSPLGNTWKFTQIIET